MRELVFHSLAEQADILSDAFLAAGALAVSIEDADRDTPDEEPIFGEPNCSPTLWAWARNRVVVLLPDERVPAEMIETVAAGLGPEYGTVLAHWVVHDVPDADWVRLTQSQFGPLHIADRIWIVPSWHRPHAAEQGEKSSDPTPLAQEIKDSMDNGNISITLDPGLAFGTGSHPTTHLCLTWLVDHVTPNASVLDYGCGSGILAIAACKLGAGRTWAVDIDEQAVITARENARLNEVVLSTMSPDDLAEGGSDIVVANILFQPLKALAPLLCARLAPGGALVLSGILVEQVDAARAAYAPWISLSVWQEREGWVCLHGRRQ